jgi:hypothetical protein
VILLINPNIKICLVFIASLLMCAIPFTLDIDNGSDTENYYKTLQTKTRASYDIKLDVYNEETDLYESVTAGYVTPGSATMYDIRVTNDGDDGDTVTLNLYLYKYETSGSEGPVEVIKTQSESDSMQADAVKNGGVIWYLKSVQSSPGYISSDSIIRDFNQVVDVDSRSGVRYVPDANSMYAIQVMLGLDPGQSAWVQVEISYPTDEVMEPMYFAVEASSGGSDNTPSNNRVECSLGIKYPDLAFDTSLGYDGLDIEKKDMRGLRFNVRVKVRNIGETDAMDFWITLFEDGQVVEKRQVMRLINSKSPDFKDILISFTWSTTPREHIVKVKIDSNNTIAELNESNNAILASVNITFSAYNITILSPELDDSDNDGMPDWWEDTYKLDPYDASDAGQDIDDDGMTNLEEYQQGTNPIISDKKLSDDDKKASDDDEKGLSFEIILAIIIIVVILLLIFIIVKKKRKN